MRFNVTTTKNPKYTYIQARLYSPPGGCIHLLCVCSGFFCVWRSRDERENACRQVIDHVCVCVRERGCGIAAEGRTISVCFFIFSSSQEERKCVPGTSLAANYTARNQTGEEHRTKLIQSRALLFFGSNLIRFSAAVGNHIIHQLEDFFVVVVVVVVSLLPFFSFLSPTSFLSDSNNHTFWARLEVQYPPNCARMTLLILIPLTCLIFHHRVLINIRKSHGFSLRPPEMKVEAPSVFVSLFLGRHTLTHVM